MNEVFTDTSHLVALLLPRDPLHHVALYAASQLPPHCRIVSSELVMVELLGHFCRGGPAARRAAVAAWKDLRSDPLVTIMSFTPQLLADALALYERSLDKSWSLTDCASFVIMRSRKIRNALTFDHHFEQAGFRALLRSAE